MKLGIIGCGLIGTKRAATDPSLILVAAADCERARAEELCTQFGGVAYTDWQDVLATDAEIIVVSTTHDQLAPIALAAVQAGKHVMLEKPGARSVSELQPVAEAAKSAGVKVKVGFNHRFHPAILKAKALIDQGELGPLLYIRGRYGHGGRIGYDQEWRFDPQISGGGELLDQGSHLIDLCRWFLGEFTQVHGVLPRYFWKGTVEDNCFMTLVTATGQCAHLHATWTEWKNIFSLEITGRDGKLSIDGLGGSYGVEQLTYYKMLPQMGPPETTIWQYPFPDFSWEREMKELLTAIEDNRAPLSDVHDALKTLSVVDKLYAGRNS